MNILLCCAAGMSTSLLVEKMKEAAKEMGVEAKIWAVSVGSLEEHIKEAEVVLIGPQIRFKINQIKALADEVNIPVDVINTVDYGMINGKKVVQHAIRLIKEAR